MSCKKFSLPFSPIPKTCCDERVVVSCKSWSLNIKDDLVVSKLKRIKAHLCNQLRHPGEQFKFSGRT